jgi:hypothetical protein
MSHIKKILSKRHQEEEIQYERTFQLIEDRSSGFGFPCDKNGVLNSDMEQVAYENYAYCLEHPDIYEDVGIKPIHYVWTEPTKALCSCGNKIYLQGDTCCDKCGQWYNSFGQSLLDPSEWWEAEQEYCPSYLALI